MNIDFDDEQRDIAATAQAFLASRLPTSRLRELAAGEGDLAVDAATWQEYADLGWLSLGVPESLGGIGVGVTHEAALFLELGRHLAPGPLLPTVAATWVCAAAGAADLVGELMGGAATAGLVVGDLVLDGAVGRWAVDLGADGRCSLREIVAAEPLTCIDASMKLHRAELGDPVVVAEDPLLVARAQLLTAAMELGIATAVRDMSVAYALDRKQFGVPIGSFQAVKHRCSDMTIRAYAAEGQLMYALWQLERRSPEAAFHAAAARLMSSRASTVNCSDNVQNHGAIGFTEEADAGLYSRRAHVLEMVLGGYATPGEVVLADGRHRFENPPALPADWWDAAHPASAAGAGR